MKKLVLVDAISSHRMRYVVEVEDVLEHALDTVVMQEATEFSQEHLGDQISSYREITEEEYLKIFDIDNDYLKDWDNEKKFNLITKIEGINNNE
jgi:hypothetical protein